MSELLARVQFYGTLQPDELRMGAGEAEQHRDDAVKHLRSLRDAHGFSTSPATLAVGAAILEAAAAAPRPPKASPRARPRGRNPRLADAAAAPAAADAAVDAPTKPKPPTGVLPSPRQSPRAAAAAAKKRTAGAIKLLPAEDWEKAKLLEAMEF